MKLDWARCTASFPKTATFLDAVEPHPTKSEARKLQLVSIR